MPIDKDGNVVPDFGDKPATVVSEGGEVTTQVVGPRKMCFILSKGNLDMAYPALILGSAALSDGIECDFFFTFWGLDIIDQRTMHDLKFTYAGNTAMHMPQLERWKGGMGTMAFPQLLAQMPGMTGFSTKMMKKMMADIDIPSVPEMLEHISAMGGNMYACQLSADMMEVKLPMLYPGVKGIISAGDFIEMSAGAQIIFV